MARGLGVRLVQPLLLGAGILVWAVHAVHLARGLWFFGDDFDFLLKRSVSVSSDGGVLVPHNEHWSTIPIVLFRLNFALFGMRHYLPYALLPVVGHVMVCASLFWLLRVIGVRVWTSVLTTLVACFTAGGVGWENILWDFQIGFVGSCVFGILAILVLTAMPDGCRRWLMCFAALLVSLMFSGIGLVMVFWAVAYTAIRDGASAALRTAVVPALVYSAWFFAFARDRVHTPRPNPAIAVHAMLNGLTDLWSQATGIGIAGPVMLALLTVIVASTRRRQAHFALGASGLVTLVAAYALFAGTRSHLGPDAATASRYAYVGVLLCLPALVIGFEHAAQAMEKRPRLAVAAWMVGVAMVGVVGWIQLDAAATGRRNVLADNEPRLVAASELVAGHAALLRPDALPIFDADVEASVLGERAVLDNLPDERPGRQAELDVAASLQVAVARSTFSLQHAAPPVLVGDAGRSASLRVEGRRGCFRRNVAAGQALDVHVGPEPVQFTLQVHGNQFDTILVSHRVRSEPVTWPSEPGETWYVGSTATNVTLRILLPSGEVTVCSG